MKKLLFVIFIINASSVFAQNFNKPLGEWYGLFTNQLKVGNVFVYRDYYWRLLYKLEIIDTVNIENMNYSKGIIYDYYGQLPFYIYLTLRKDNYFVAYDSMANYYTGKKYIYYKKDAQIGDYWIQYRNGWGCDTCKVYYNIIDIINLGTFWGQSVPVKWLRITDSVLTMYWEFWSEEFGLVQANIDDYQINGVFFLWGCVINDTVYGDTSFTVSVNDKNDIIASDFELYQNFPNPFNAVTTIKYKLNKSGFVRLKIYDVLGNEVALLLNEEKSAGTYYVDFDSERLSNSKTLSSSIYFYEFTFNNYRKVKKMILNK